MPDYVRSVDFEHAWLPQTPARVSRSHSKISVELRVDRNWAPEMAVARREIDIALVFGSARRPTRRSSTWSRLQSSPLSLISQGDEQSRS
jgi:DNA-binding transcriptional LysR family regulator